MASSPVTLIETKDHIRLNAVNHSAYTQPFVLTNDDRAAFEKALRGLETRYQPQTPEEIELVQTLHQTSCRLDSALANERNLHLLTTQQQMENIDKLFGEQEESVRRGLAQAAGLQANMRLFDQLSRHIGRLHRLMDQTRRWLDLRIGQRRQAEQAARAQQLDELENMTEQSQPARAQNAAPLPEMPKFTGSLKEFKRKQWLRQQEKRIDTFNAA